MACGFFFRLTVFFCFAFFAGGQVCAFAVARALGFGFLAAAGRCFARFGRALGGFGGSFVCAGLGGFFFEDGGPNGDRSVDRGAHLFLPSYDSVFACVDSELVGGLDDVSDASESLDLLFSELGERVAVAGYFSKRGEGFLVGSGLSSGHIGGTIKALFMALGFWEWVWGRLRRRVSVLCVCTA